MRTVLFTTMALLTWAIYDPNLFRRRSASTGPTSIELTLSDLAEEGQRQKKIIRRNAEVIPWWHRNKKSPVVSRCNYFQTNPRDVRFSNQRKIRRMFNNA